MRKNKNFYRSAKANNTDNDNNKAFSVKNSNNAENSENTTADTTNRKTAVIADNAEKTVNHMIEEADNNAKNRLENSINEAKTADSSNVMADSSTEMVDHTNNSEPDSATSNTIALNNEAVESSNADNVVEDADSGEDTIVASYDTPATVSADASGSADSTETADSSVVSADLDDFVVDNGSQEKDNFMHSPANFDFNMSGEPRSEANMHASEAPTEVISPNFTQSPRYDAQTGAYGMPMSTYNSSVANGGYSSAYNNPYSAANMPPKQAPTTNGMMPNNSDAQADKIIEFFKKPIFWEVFGVIALVIVVLQLFVTPIFSRYNTYSYYVPRTQSQYNTTVPRNNSDSRKDLRNNTDSDNSADSAPNNSMRRSALSEFDWYSLRGMRLSNAFALLQHYGLRENRDFKADFVTDNGDYVLLRSNWIVDKAQLDGNRVLFTLHQANNTPRDNDYYDAQKKYDQKLRNERDGINHHDNGAINNPSVLERLQRDGANAFRSAADSLKNAIGQAANGLNH